MAQSCVVKRGEKEASTSGRQETCFMSFEANSTHLVGETLHKAPKIDKFEFCQWNLRIRTFMMAHDMGAWFTITRGLGIPSNDEKYMMEVQADVKAKCFLYEALDSHNFNMVLSCYTSKEIWEKLEETYGERRKEKAIEETQCTTSGSQSLNENESCLMAIEELEVTSNSFDSTSYTLMNCKMHLRS